MEIYKTMSNLAVPTSLNYSANVLPVAIESRSSTRIFEPVNGVNFRPDANNVIRFNINSDNLWDISHSYLACVFKNESTAAAAENNRLVLDDGVPWLSRVQIMSGGQELENISEYHRLHAFMQQMQGNPAQAGEWAVTNNQNFPVDEVGVGGVIVAAAAGAAYDQAEQQQIVDQVRAATTVALGGTATHGIYKHALDTNKHTALRGTVADEGYRDQFTYNFSIISGILNTTKLFPLIFSNLGIDVLLYLAPAVDIGVWGTPASTAAQVVPEYSISQCKWHCHLVDVDQAFYDSLRSQMMSTGGMLQFSGTTYKHYLETANNSGDIHTLTVPTRVKSLNALYIRPQRQSLNNQFNRFCLSVSEGCMMQEYVFRIGSMQYPQQSIKISSGKNGTSLNPGELYNEIRKSQGVLNNYGHNSWLNRTTLKTGPKSVAQAAAGNSGLFTADDTGDGDVASGRNVTGTAEEHGTTNTAGQVKSMFAAVYNFEGFSKVAAESGLNLSDRALACQCEIKRTPILQFEDDAGGNAGAQLTLVAPEVIRYDIWAQADFLLFLTADGQMSTQV